MAGVDTILRLIGASVAFVAVIIIGAVGWQVIDPLYNNLGLGDLPSQWGAPQETVMFMAGLASIGLLIVIAVWWIVSPIRDDVRQDVRGGGRF